MSKLNILIVEDNEGDIILLKEAFEEINSNVSLNFIRNGSDAYKFLFNIEPFTNAIAPDVLLLDLNLPMKSGMEILEAIKNSETHRMLPTIILTTSSDHRDIKAAYQNQANCFITKPIEISEYFEVVEEIYKFWFNLVKLPTP